MVNNERILGMTSDEGYVPDPTSPNISANLHEAAAALEHAVCANPVEAGQDLQRAEGLIEQACNELIDWLRKDPGDPQSRHWKVLLTQLNRVIPLIARDETPADGLHERIVQAKRTLENLF